MLVGSVDIRARAPTVVSETREIGGKTKTVSCCRCMYCQVLECEAVMPLTLAATDTCVVVAGDHLQMSQRVHSSVARQLKLSQSIVERLKLHYSDVTSSSDVSIALTRNYRNHRVILRFLSSIYYGGPDVLIACTDQPETSQLKPMNFFAAQGEEMQDDCSTSWYNVAEVEEVVTRVMELYKNWPTEWGKRSAESILVTTAYSDQVHMSTCLCKTHNVVIISIIIVIKSIAYLLSLHQLFSPAYFTYEFGFLQFSTFSYTVDGHKLVTKLQNMATCEKRCSRHGSFS